MKRRLSTILARCIKALLWLVWGSMAAAPAHAVTYLVMAKPGFNVKPQRAESLFELKLILFALKAEGVGLKTVVVTTQVASRCRA